MANFKIALAKTLEYEGVYSNNQKDPGGETVFGVSRKYHSGWTGWETIDKIKSLSIYFEDWIETIKSSEELVLAVDSFYETEFWDKLHGYLIMNQDLANFLFDTAVHCGVDFAVKSLQDSLNVLLKYSLKVDGNFGGLTMTAFENVERLCMQPTLLKMLMVARGNKFIELARNNEFHRKNLRGYFKRVFA